MAQKPDFKKTKELMAAAEMLDSSMKGALDAEKGEIAAVREAADSFYSYKLKKALSDMSVEMLGQGKQGIRVSYLKDAGIDDIYKLSKMSVPAIEALSGIGDQGARRIYELCCQIVDNTKKKLSVRINADEPAEADNVLIRALYVLICHNSFRERIRKIYDENHKPLLKELEGAKSATGGLKWFFASSREREGALLCVSSIEERMAGEFDCSDALKLYNDILRADITECRAHFRENSPSYYTALETYCKHLNTQNAPETGLPAELLSEIEAHPLDLQYMKATLRSYQAFGVKYALHQKRTLLGDDMGLGKTIQAIASMAALKAEGKHHFLVVCPASVLINWAREIEKHSTMNVTKIHGLDEEALYRWRTTGDVAVTTYESISRFALPDKFTFDMLVVDEAHYVKNPDAQRTVAMGKLLPKAEYVLYMSGTPLVNRVDEMCFLVKCLQPDIAQKLESVKTISTAEQFRSELAPVYLRRTKEDVLRELPELIEKEQWCSLSEKEYGVYKSAVQSGNLMAIRQVSWQMDNIEESTKAQRLMEICNDVMESGRKAIVFSFFRNTLDKVCTLLGDRCSEIISGDISPARRQEIVDTFNSAAAGAVLVSQVQAGGTGLNIQSASVVIFCEPQLTPAIENQAIGRAHRMGQTRDVLVYRLLADDTVDERMLEILSGKQKEFDSFADESVIGDSQVASDTAEEGSWVTKMVREEQERLAAVAGDDVK